MKLLLIDDSLENLIIYKILLDEIKGVEIYEARTGLEALKLAEENLFHMVISDVSMPGMDGFETIRRMRKISGYETVSVIFISAIVLESDSILEGYEAGAIDYMVKPINHALFQIKINTLIKIQKQRIQLDQQYQEITKVNKILQSITSSIQEGILLTNSLGEILFSNESANNLLQLNLEEKNKENIFSYITNNDSKETLKFLFSESRTMVADLIEMNLQDQKGSSFPVEISLSSIEAGKGINYVFVFREISAKKVLEEQRLMEKEYREANQIMANFMDNINHELKTPLNQISGLASLMLRYESTNLEEEQLKSLNKINKESEKLAGLIDTILDFRDITTLKLGTIEISECYKHIKESADRLLKKKNINYEVIFDISDTKYVKIDIEKLKIIIDHLLVNALKFTKQGIIKVIITSTPEDLSIQITDTGIGLSEEEAQKIFSPFYQIQTGADRGFGGLGLGLALVNKLTRLMFGNISVESVPGKGTMFCLVFPLKNKHNE